MHFKTTVINVTLVFWFEASSHTPVVLPDTNSKPPPTDSVAWTAAASLKDALTVKVADSPADIELGPETLKDALAAETGKLRTVKINASINETLMIFFIFLPILCEIILNRFIFYCAVI